jgi:hypothetical protein
VKVHDFVMYDTKCRWECRRALITERFIFDRPVKTGTMEFGEWENVHIRLSCEDWYNDFSIRPGMRKHQIWETNRTEPLDQDMNVKHQFHQTFIKGKALNSEQYSFTLLVLHRTVFMSELCPGQKPNGKCKKHESETLLPS